MRRILNFLGIALAASAIVALMVWIQTWQPPIAYPEKPIHIVVLTEQGEADDIVTRLVTPKISKILGQPIIIENRPAQDALIGMDHVLRAQPDGYTLMIASDDNLVTYSQIAPNFIF